MLRESYPIGLEDDKLTIEFPPSNSFHRKLVEEPKNAALLAEALYEVTGRRLAVAFELAEAVEDEEVPEEEPAGEEDLLALMKETFDARELEES